MTRDVEIRSRAAGTTARPLEIAVVHRAVRREIPVVVVRPRERAPRPRPAWLRALVAA